MATSPFHSAAFIVLVFALFFRGAVPCLSHTKGLAKIDAGIAKRQGRPALLFSSFGASDSQSRKANDTGVVFAAQNRLYKQLIPTCRWDQSADMRADDCCCIARLIIGDRSPTRTSPYNPGRPVQR